MTQAWIKLEIILFNAYQMVSPHNHRLNLAEQAILKSSHKLSQT